MVEERVIQPKKKRSKSDKAAQKRYANVALITRVCRFNKNTDTDIIDWIDKENLSNYQGYIKQLIREDMKNNGAIKDTVKDDRGE